MTEVQNKFVWYDLMTTDTKAAESFYHHVAGWEASDAGMTHASYTLLSLGHAMVAGLMAIPEEALARGAKPAWLGHIGVDDVDAYVERVRAAGGAVHRAPSEIPGVGRFAVVADPDGASFILFQSWTESSPQTPQTPGHIGWHELHAGQWERAWRFYSDLFSWTKAEAVDMGPMGVYQTFAAGGAPIGGMMTKMPDLPAPFWLYYIYVDAVDGAVERATASGAQLLMGPHEVPGGSWIAQFLDPQGAMFAVVGPRKQGLGFRV